MMKWMHIQLLLQLYFNTVIALQSTKERCSWLGKIKIIETAAMLMIISDVPAVTPDGSLYPSSADMLSTALIYLPDTSPMGKGCGKHAGMNSMYCPSHNAVHENMGFAPSIVVDRVLQLYDLGARFLVTTWSQILQLLQTSAVLQLPRVLSSSSLLLMMLTET